MSYAVVKPLNFFQNAIGQDFLGFLLHVQHLGRPLTTSAPETDTVDAV